MPRWFRGLIILRSGFDSRHCCKFNPPVFFHQKSFQMKKRMLFTIAFIIIGALAVIGQETKHFNLFDDTDSLRASNVTIGRYTITALYPDMEFRFYPAEMKIRISRTDSLGQTQDQVLDALVSQVTGFIYRADVCENTFVEINAATGSTFVHQHCITHVWVNDPEAWSCRVTTTY